MENTETTHAAQAGIPAGAFDWHRLLNVLSRYRWVLVTLTSMAFFASLFYAFIEKDYYVARSKIYVQNIEQSPLKKDEIVTPMLDRTTYYRTQMTLLQGSPVLEEAARALGLGEHYKDLIKKGAGFPETVEVLKKRVFAKLIPGTQIIELGVRDKDPEFSARIANMIAEIFVKQSLRDRLFVSDQILKWFPDEAEALRRSTALEQLRSIDTQDVVSTLPSVINDPVIQQLKEERAKVDAEVRELAETYTGEHPRMKELRAKAGFLEHEIETQTRQIVSGLKAGLSGALNVTDIRIAEPARAPLKPAGPKRLLIIFLATGGMLWASIMLVLVFDYLDRKLKTEDDLRQAGFSFMGYIPFMPQLANNAGPSGEKPKILRLMEDEEFQMNEAAEIRTSVLFSMPKDHHKVIAVTSALPGEGKTTIASLLALSFEETGEKVLLVDADMFKPAVHKYFGLENVIGLSNLLAGTHLLKDAVQELRRFSRFHVITAGPSTPNAPMLLNSDTFAALIEETCRHFDRVILDIPPLLIVADGLIAMRRAHGVLVVFKYNLVHQGAARKMREKIEASGCPLLGAVMNQVHYKKTLPYEGYHYRHYRDYYRHRHRPLKDETEKPGRGRFSTSA